jgi:hypothetical protein
VHNIEDMINERAPSHIPTWNAVCIADTKGLSQYADYMRAYLGDVIINYD